MNEHLDHDSPAMPRERELTLSTGAILGIFFGLVLLCGLCFGVGYNMGHKAVPAPLALNEGSQDTPSADTGVAAGKPSAGSPAESSVPAIVSATPATVASTPVPSSSAKAAPIVRKPPATAPEPANPLDSEASAAPGRTTVKPVASEAPVVRAVPPSALLPSAAAPGTGSVMVQVAAVSHQEDADLLVGALRSRGYTVIAHPASSDGFIHVQVGPFADKKAAEAMRQRLLGDGYNAILK